jgi:hypothetical protein
MREMSAADTKPKPKYEAPVVVPLGELALGHGKTCNHGSDAAQNCHVGSTAGKACAPGASK